MNFLSAAKGTEIVAIAAVVKAGRTLIVTRIDVDVIEGLTRTLCAVLQQTMMPVAVREE